MKKIIILSLLFVVIPLFTCYSQDSKEKIYDELVKIYKYVTTVSFDFKLLEENFSGSLTVKKGNKYKMEIGGRIIISNGKTIWNYSPKENKVVISDLEEIGDQVSLESFFFSFLENFQPVKLTEKKTSKGIEAYVLDLKVKENTKSFQKISTVEIWIDRGTYDIIQFHINEPQQMTWHIEKLRLRKKASNSIFDFQPNEDCTIVDLR
ncbi:outer membrane lipoprotein carrier protein LolA [Bacteroidota bacterium]